MPISRHHEPQTRQAYVSDLTRRLRRSLPRDKAGQIAGEAQAHLEDTVEDLVAQGVAEQDAERQALAGFGPVRTYARAAVAEFYGDRTSARGRRAARLGAASFLGFNVLYTLYPGGYEQYLMLGAIAGGLTVPLLALVSRRPQTRALVALSLVTLLAVGIGAGLRYVPNPDTAALEFARYNSPTQSLNGGPGIVRDDYRARIALKKQTVQLLRDEIARLRQGMTTFIEQNKAPVPAPLRHGGRFIVPNSYPDTLYTFGTDAVDVSPFRDYPRARYTPQDHRAESAAFPVRTVATRQEATAAWSENAPPWLTAKRDWADENAREIATLDRAARAPLGFNWGAATYHVSLSLWLCLALVVLDFVLAHVGRAIWLRTRNFPRGSVR